MLETEIEGQRFEGKMCIMSDQAQCALDLKIFAIENTLKGLLYSESSGYLGLGLGEGYGGGKELNTLDQLYSQGLIGSKKFGVYTVMKNSTDSHSQIRFGGFNEDLLVDKHSLQWMPTTSTDSWKILIHSITFNTDDILQDSSTALINPGFPYIAAPFSEFKRFKTDLKYAHATLKCEEESAGLCYFKKTCQSLAERLPPLIFTLGPETRK